MGRPDPEDDVERVLSDLQAPVREHEVRFQPGVLLGELRQQRRHVHAPKVHGRAEPQPPARHGAPRGDFRLRVAQQREQLGAASVIQLALVGEGEPLRAPGDVQRSNRVVEKLLDTIL